jgi:hypothetical protein
MTRPITRPHFRLATALSAGWLAVGGLAQNGAAQARTVAQKVSPTQPAIISADIEDANVRQAMYSVRGDLRQLVLAQENFWRARRTYASDIGALTMFHPAPGVAVQIVHARTDGWSARAGYSDGLGVARSCVIWVGDIAPTDRPATDLEHKVYPEAEVSCDGDGYTTKGEWGAAGRAYMTYALDKLTQSEVRFFAFHHRFTAEEDALDPFIWDRDVSVSIVAASATGWAARASFGATPGKTCIIWHGTLSASDIPTTTAEQLSAGEGQVVCDGATARLSTR